MVKLVVTRMPHIIWDWNGTLLDDVGPCVSTINVILCRRGKPPLTVRRYREVFCFPVRRYYEHLGLYLTADEWARIAVEYHDLYRVKAARAPLRRGILTVVETFHRRGFAQSILSASEVNLLEQMVRARAIRDRFTCVAGLRDYYAHSKIDLGRELLAAAGGDPAATVLIGDTIHDWEVATDLGCRCILLAGGHQDLARLRACGAEVVRHPAELAGKVI